MIERETQRDTAGGTPRRSQSRRRPDVAEAPADPERIRILAYEIYQTRSSSGTLGDPVSDWLEAERRLNESAATGRDGHGQDTTDRDGPVRGRSEPAARAETRSGTRKKPSGK